MRTKYNERTVSSGFSDNRHYDRFTTICKNIESNLSGTIPEISSTKGSTKAMYRFFDNKAITPEQLIQVHQQKTFKLLSTNGLQRFLQIDDSTELDYTNKKGAAQMGPLTYLKRRGLVLHNSLLLTDQAVPIGLLHQSYIQRTDEDFGQSASRKSLPAEEKESYRWVAHFLKGQALCEQNKELEGLYIADREADLIELYHQRTCERMHQLVRCKHNRRLNGQSDKLFPHLSKQDLQGVYQVEVTDSDTKQTRIAQVEVRFCQVELTLCNKRTITNHIEPIAMYTVEAKEVNVPTDVNNAIHWRLLTTLPVTNFEQAMEIINYYTLRWIIERFHYMLKSGGAKVEELQLHKVERIKKAVTTYSIAALNVFKIRYLAEYQPHKIIYEVGITPTEYKVLFTYANKKVSSNIRYIPDQPPTVEQFCIVLGQIGGFLPSKKQKLPGLKILSRAVRKFNTMLDTYFSFFQ